MNEWERVALDSAKSRAKAIKDRTIADIEDNKNQDASKASKQKRFSPSGTSSESKHHQEGGKNTIDEFPKQDVPCQ